MTRKSIRARVTVKASINLTDQTASLVEIVKDDIEREGGYNS